VKGLISFSAGQEEEKEENSSIFVASLAHQFSILCPSSCDTTFYIFIVSFNFVASTSLPIPKINFLLLHFLRLKVA
jgi:hypothetical protein